MLIIKYCEWRLLFKVSFFLLPMKLNLLKIPGHYLVSSCLLGSKWLGMLLISRRAWILLLLSSNVSSAFAGDRRSLLGERSRLGWCFSLKKRDFQPINLKNSQVENLNQLRYWFHGILSWTYLHVAGIRPAKTILASRLSWLLACSKSRLTHCRTLWSSPQTLLFLSQTHDLLLLSSRVGGLH